MNTTFTMIGLRAATTIRSAEHDLAVSGGIGWRHAFGDVDPELAMAFAGGANFDIAGAAIARNAAVLDLGVDMNLGKKAIMRLDYQASLPRTRASTALAPPSVCVSRDGNIRRTGMRR